MRPLLFILLSLVFVFGDADPDELELPATVRKCTSVEEAACGASFICRIDYDGIRHCVGGSQGVGPVYPKKPEVVNGGSISLSGYRDVSYYKDLNNSNQMNGKDKFVRIIGDMDVVGASVVMPRVSGFGFEPSLNGTKDDPSANTSPVIEKIYINEEPGLGTSKFPNSSRATFNFEDKSEFERTNIDKTKIIYARLFWGGAVYDDWEKSSGLLNVMYENIFGYSSVRFKTPDGLVHVIKAREDDIKWDASFTPYNPNTVTRDTYYKYCKDPKNPEDTGGCDTKYTLPLHPDPNDKTKPLKSTVGVRSGMYFTYQASADVTDLVRASLGKTKEGRTFAVGGIASTIKKTTPRSYKVTIDAQEQDAKVAHGTALYADGDWSISYVASQYGGWSLVIVYDFKEEGELKLPPKTVNIYRGMSNISPLVKRKKSTSTQTTQNTLLDLTFDDLFTPTTGTVKSTLAFMGFGGRKELKGEDIRIKKGDNFQSVFRTPSSSEDVLPNYGNLEHNQFDSSITRFGKLANDKKKFNAMMDLDIFDVSNFVGNKLKKINMQFETVALNTGGDTQGDRLNLGMVAFSTELYDPKVCYSEILQVLDAKTNVWKDVAIKGASAKENDGKAKTAKTGDKLKTIVTIQNNGNEYAEETFLKIKFDPKFISYEQNSSCLLVNTTNPKAVDCNPFNDKDKRVEINQKEHSLEYVIGDGADVKKGGKLKANHENYARLRFIGVLNSEYKKTEYSVRFKNSAIGLNYNGKIKECDPIAYDLKVLNEEENDFYPRSRKDDPSGNFKNKLYTKIANKPFDITISNYKKTDGTLKAPDSDTDVTLKLVTDCSSDKSVIPAETLHFTTSTHTITRRVTVPRPYPDLHVKLSYQNKITNLTDEKCAAFDSFAVRPATFGLYDAITNSAYTDKTLIGGKSYSEITLGAYDANGGLANGYTNTLKADSTTDKVLLASVKKGTSDCVLPTAISDGSSDQLQVSFNDPDKAIGIISKLGSTSDDDSGFSFSDIGEAYFDVRDASYTKVDQKATQQDSDCALGKSYNEEDGDGKFGCDINFNQHKFNFAPKDLEVSDFKILGGGVSYIANEKEAPSPTLSFKVRARLFNDNPALLYQNGCYANNTTFKIKAGEIIAEYTDNSGSKLSSDAAGVDRLNSEIIFFDDSNPAALVKKVNLSPHDGAYSVKKEAFGSDGYADVSLKFNFAREKNVAKNPFEVTSDIFTFESLAEDQSSRNKTKGDNYKKPTTKTSAKFYYARTYAPYYEGPNTGFKAKIYYGVYCNGCDESKFMLQKPGSSARWEEFAGTHSWYVNPLHDASYGNVDSYDFSNHTTRDTAKEKALSDGISYIYVKNDRAVTDIAKMHTENWLIYNEFDKDAATNDFTVRFLVPNGDWAGKTLKSGSGKGDVGNVIGGENNFNDLSDKTNRRISW